MRRAIVRAVFTVHVNVDRFHSGLQPGLEALIKACHVHIEHSLKHLRLGLCFSVLMNQGQQTLETEGFGDVFHHQIGLIVSEVQIGIAPCRGERIVEPCDGCNALLLYRPDQIKPLAAAPLWSAESLFPC